MPVKKRPKLEKTIFDEEFAQDRADRRTENRVDERIASEDMKRCFDLMQWQMEQPIAGAFLDPVDWRALDLPLYPQLIKRPMDLNTVKSKLLSGEIATPSKFAEMMRLVYRNAMKFNQAGSQIHDFAQQLLDIFDGNFEHVKIEKPAPAPTMMDLDPIVPAHNPYAELEATIASYESRLASLQEETAALKASNQTRAEEQALVLQPHLRIEKLDVSYPRKPFTYAEKEALCLRLAEYNDNGEMIEGLLKVIDVDLDSNGGLELDVENFDDETLHRIAEYLDRYTERLNSNQRYGYGDDEDYVDPIKRKKPKF